MGFVFRTAKVSFVLFMPTKYAIRVPKIGVENPSEELQNRTDPRKIKGLRAPEPVETRPWFLHMTFLS